ncbi:MAG: hypothetical protein NZT61_03895 [Deltaproteobacteria bacterium]|nr:hypothetical protein [Deltaproteobacteria bacterium]
MRLILRLIEKEFIEGDFRVAKTRLKTLKALLPRSQRDFLDVYFGGYLVAAVNVKKTHEGGNFYKKNYPKSTPSADRLNLWLKFRKVDTFLHRSRALLVGT